MLTKSAMFMLNFYRNCISPLMLPRCRFYPSCSAYTHQAIQKKGLCQGLSMALRRIFRCHPFSRAAFYDPVD